MGRLEGKRAIAEFGGLDVAYANAGISGGLSSTHPFRRPRP